VASCVAATAAGAFGLAALPHALAATNARHPTLNRTQSWYHARLVRAACAVLLAVSATTLSCAEAAHGPLAGASDAWTRAPEPTSPSTRESGKPASGIWEGYAEVQRWPAATAVPFTTRGHLPEQQVELRVNDAARAQYAALVTDSVFPDGSQLAELSRSGGHSYVMRKNAGVWSYFELDGQGALLASGALSLCAGCHAQAPSDRVFGLPRAP